MPSSVFDQFFPVHDDSCTETCLLYRLAGNTICDGVKLYETAETAVEVQPWPYPS